VSVESLVVLVSVDDDDESLVVSVSVDDDESLVLWVSLDSVALELLVSVAEPVESVAPTSSPAGLSSPQASASKGKVSRVEVSKFERISDFYAGRSALGKRASVDD